MINRRAAFFGALAVGAGYLTHKSKDFDRPYPREISYSDFLTALENNTQISKITIEGNKLILESDRHNQAALVRIPDFADKDELLNLLVKSDAEVWQQTNTGQLLRITHQNLVSILGGVTALLASTSATAQMRASADRRHLKNLEENIHHDHRKSVAYHEAGHAIASFLLPGMRKADIITIKPNIDYMGFVDFKPHKKVKEETYEMLQNELIIDMAGRAAEIVGMGENQYSTGARADMKNSKEIATAMVMEYGMSKAIGPIAYEPQPSGIVGFFRARTMTPQKETQIEAEIEKLVNTALDYAVKILEVNKDKLDLLTDTLLKRETLSADEARKITGLYETDETTLKISRAEP